MSAGERPQERRGFRGYVTARPFGGLHIPVPIQNLILRDFTGRRGMVFKLPPNEFVMPGCFLQLEGMFHELPRLEGIVMASYFMLPATPEKRRTVYDAVFGAGAELAFAMEDLRVGSHEAVAGIEDALGAYHLLQECPGEADVGPMPLDLPAVPGWTVEPGPDWNPRA